jgi:hypothetical protein
MASRQVGQRVSDANLRRMRMAVIAGDAGQVRGAYDQLTQTDIVRLVDNGVLRDQILRLEHPLRLVERIEAALQDPPVAFCCTGERHQPLTPGSPCP